MPGDRKEEALTVVQGERCTHTHTHTHRRMYVHKLTIPRLFLFFTVQVLFKANAEAVC